MVRVSQVAGGPTGPADSRADAGADVPQRLREARERAGLSLRELARRLDLSASALSQIETGKSRPSVRTLYAVVQELGLSLDELFAAPGPTLAPNGLERALAAVTPPSDAAALASLARAGRTDGPTLGVDERPELQLGSGVTWARLTREHDQLVDFLQVRYEPGATSNADGSLVRHAGYEYGVVLSGRLEVSIGFETYVLEEGGSISFSSNEPHLLANRTDEPAEAIWFVIGRRGTDPRDPAFDER